MYNDQTIRHYRKNCFPELFVFVGSFMLFSLFVLFSNVPTLEARVKGGNCADCHTMHNSQNNSPMVFIGTVGNPAGWDGSTMAGGYTHVAQAGLLISDCVGCHSSSTADSLVQLGTLKVPIVFNTVEPANGFGGLAGGNFYWMVAETDSTKGHNVAGISAIDLNFPGEAPGSNAGCWGSQNCHRSLTYAAVTKDNVEWADGGCQACHTPKHHGKAVADGDPENADSGWYRFLDGNAKHAGHRSVIGIEDPNWENNPTADDHNVYFSGSPALVDPATNQGIGRFCAGCHHNFHAQGTDDLGFENNGSGANDDPWLRHPSDFVIPSTDEYATVIGREYDPLTPVGKQSLTSGSHNVVEAGDKVMCLSCHRAHGSPYPDMLRWDYTGGGEAVMSHSAANDTDPGTGCFYCHTTKDDP